MQQSLPMATYRLYADNEGVEAPDGNEYTLNPEQAEPGQWLFAYNGRVPVMAYIAKPGKFYKGSDHDGVLVVTLRESIGLAATFDGGNNNILDHKVFIMRAQGIEESPVLNGRRSLKCCV